ncbi:hypothetical protein Efla_005070 [Eimeria flavescens]
MSVHRRREAGSRGVPGAPLAGKRFSRNLKRQPTRSSSSSRRAADQTNTHAPGVKRERQQQRQQKALLHSSRQQQHQRKQQQQQQQHQRKQQQGQQQERTQQQGQQQQRTQQQGQRQQRPREDDPAARQLEQQQLQQHVLAAVQQQHSKDASARRWAERQQQKQQQQQKQKQRQQRQQQIGAAAAANAGADSSSSSSKRLAAAAPAFLAAAETEAARAAAAAADALLQEEDVLQWLDTWGKAPWHAGLKSAESAVMELPLPKGSSSSSSDSSSSNSSSSSSSVDWALWAAVGDRALQHVTDRFYALLQTDSEQRWILKNAGLLQQQQQQQQKPRRRGNGEAAGEQRKGATRTDEISSLVVLTQQSPLCSSKCLLLLLRLACSKNRSAAHAAAGQLYELFRGPLLLPSFRKLRPLQQQPAWLLQRVALLLPLLQQQLQQQAKQQQQGKKQQRKQQQQQQQQNAQRSAAVALLQLLLFWRFEETLAQRYNSFVMLLRALSEDHVAVLSCRALKFAAELLMRKPEREQQLLSLLVDRLGAHEGKVASCASFQLALLLRRHREMLPVVCTYTAESVLQRLAAVLQQGKRQALEAFLTLKAVIRRTRGRLPARLKYRHHELQQQQQQQQQPADAAAAAQSGRCRSSSVSSRIAARARELHRLLLRTKSSSSSSSSSGEERRRAVADVRVYDLLLSPKFAAGLQGVYRGLLFLSETIFKEGDGAAAARLVEVYLSVFRRLSDFGVYVHAALQEAAGGSAKPSAAAAAAAAAAGGGAGSKRQVALLPPLYLSAYCNRLVRVMLAGLLRALPFVSPEAAATLLLQAPLQSQQQHRQQQQQQRGGGSEHLSEVLFTLAHTLPCVASRVLAMRTLHCLTVLYNHSPDRLARLVYGQLQQQHADLYAGRRAGLLLLLVGLLLQDRHSSRQAALLKRLLQTGLAHASPGVTAAALQVVEAVLLQQPQLRMLLSDTESELQQTDDAVADLTDEDEETAGASGHHETKAAAGAATAANAACVYVPEKRDPRFTRASETRLWEISVCSASFHPRVSANASRLISTYCSSSGSSSSSTSSGVADALAVDEAALVETLRSVTATSLLDDLAYKAPQQQHKQQQQQQQQQEQRVCLNSARYWQRHEAEPERQFIRQYFLDRVVVAGQLQQRAGKGAAAAAYEGEGDGELEGSDAEELDEDQAISDEEVDAFLEQQARQLGGDESEEEDAEEEEEEEDDDDEDEDEDEGEDEDDAFSSEGELSLDGSEGSEVGGGDDPLEEASTSEGGEGSDEERGKRKRRPNAFKEQERMKSLRRHLDRRAIHGTVFADAEGIEDLLK